MTRNSYPEEIYTTETGATITSPKKRRMVEKAYTLGTLRSGATRQDLDKAYDVGFERGKKHKDNLTGFSNLTEAIAAGERIDWDALDGLEAKCVHPELGTLTHRLERNTQWSKHTSIGWHHNKEATWAAALNHAWGDKGRWSLWVKGELPLRKQTADQLEPGTCFRARYEKNGETHNYAWAQLLKPSGQKPRVIFLSQALTTLFGSALPEDVEVIEVYGVGTFKKPKENA